MIIHYFYIIKIISIVLKTYSILIIDSNAILPFPITI